MNYEVSRALRKGQTLEGRCEGSHDKATLISHLDSCVSHYFGALNRRFVSPVRKWVLLSISFDFDSLFRVRRIVYGFIIEAFISCRNWRLDRRNTEKGLRLAIKGWLSARGNLLAGQWYRRTSEVLRNFVIHFSLKAFSFCWAFCSRRVSRVSRYFSQRCYSTEVSYFQQAKEQVYSRGVKGFTWSVLSEKNSSDTLQIMANIFLS